jgi:hypothetical protein
MLLSVSLRWIQYMHNRSFSPHKSVAVFVEKTKLTQHEDEVKI